MLIKGEDGYMIKKLLISITILLSMLGATQVNAAGDQPPSWAQASVNEAIKLGFVPEEIQGDYNKAITRKEFAEMFVEMSFAKQRYSKISKEDFLNTVEVTDYTFTDVDSENVKIAYAMGLTNGVAPGKFGPDVEITREQAAVMFSNYYKTDIASYYQDMEKMFSDLNKAEKWARDSIYVVVQYGLINGTSVVERPEALPLTTFDPKGKFTRAQAISVMNRLYSLGSLKDSVKVKGWIDLDVDGFKYKYKVGKNSIAVTGSKEEGAYSNFAMKYITGAAVSYSDEKITDVYPNITKTEYFAVEHGNMGVFGRVFSEDVYKALNTHTYAKFDLGYAYYEVNGSDFLFKYTIKPEAGIHTSTIYGGSKNLEAKCVKVN